MSALDLRYLSTVRVGPVASRAAWIGDRDGGAVRVTLHDRGRGDRVTTSGVVHVARIARPE